VSRLSDFGSFLLDETCFHPSQEILTLGFCLIEDFRLVTELKRDFLQHEFYRIFGPESLSDQLTNSGCKAFVIGGAEAGEMIGALVVAEFSGCEAIEGSARVGIVQQRR
jgi:hypothetical protein